MKLQYIILFFAVYSFIGWIIEVIYRSFTHNQLVNPGFLFGPFVPVYGFGALVIIFVHDLIIDVHIAGHFIIYFFLLSTVEYITGELFERFFHLKLWDYSENKFNLNGKVCLSFSLAWAGLAMCVIYVLHPFIAGQLYRLESGKALAVSGVFGAYFVADVSMSVVSMNRFRAGMRYLYEKYVTLSNTEVNRMLDSFRRILRAFPDINKSLNENLGKNIKLKVHAAMGKMSDIVESVVAERRPDDDEYNSIVKEILYNEEFLKLRNFFHHNSSIYEHAKVVSYIAYRTCKYLNLDYVSAARGGLLHDFFLYDWRSHDEPDLRRDKYHGIEHPKIALRNSIKNFQVNEVERDIILKHMWPLTIVPPRYQESYVVTVVDKYVSSREFIDEFRKRRERGRGGDTRASMS